MNARDERLDELAIRVSRCLNGERLDDIASVCALLAAYSICEFYETNREREEALQTIIEFMRELIAKGDLQ
jgi:hypothetical protein